MNLLTRSTAKKGHQQADLEERLSVTERSAAIMPEGEPERPEVLDRSVLTNVAVASNGAFFSAELLIKLRAAGVVVAEVGVPHFPRTAGSASGARLSVVLKAVRDFWSLRFALWRDRDAALRRGEPLL